MAPTSGGRAEGGGTHRGASPFVKAAVFLQLLVQLPPGGEFQHQVNALAIVEVVIHAQDVRVSVDGTSKEDYTR